MLWPQWSIKPKKKPCNPVCLLCLSCLGATVLGALTFNVLRKHFRPQILADAVVFRDSPKVYHEAQVLSSGYSEYGKGHCFGASPCNSDSSVGSLCHNWVYKPSFDPKLQHLAADQHDDSRERRLMWLLQWSEPRKTQMYSCHAVPWLLVEFQDGNRSENHSKNHSKRRCSYLYGTIPRSQVSYYSLSVPSADSQSGEDKAKHMLKHVIDGLVSPDRSIQVWVQPGTSNCVVGFGSLDDYVLEVLATEHDFHRDGPLLATCGLAFLVIGFVVVQSVLRLRESASLPSQKVAEMEYPDSFNRIYDSDSEDEPLFHSAIIQ
mmetsp:Transcript_131455/g.232250  ORF Transcript_131455/g.232250 Transcript_131455/m.232250 type:complete len:319 (+) Transcript_131455:83-1039(+)